MWILQNIGAKVLGQLPHGPQRFQQKKIYTPLQIGTYIQLNLTIVPPGIMDKSNL